jgi:hypothetical protein
MAEDTRKTYTVRLPEQVAARIDNQASGAGIAPTTLIQSCLIRHFGDRNPSANDVAGSQPQPVAISAKLAALQRVVEQWQQMAAQRHDQLMFEIVKTRSALFHALDQSVGAAAVDEIIEASERAARQYLDRLATPDGAKP